MSRKDTGMIQSFINWITGTGRTVRHTTTFWGCPKVEITDYDKGTAPREFASRGSGATRTHIGARALAEAGRVNSKGREACFADGILATTRGSVLDVTRRDPPRAIPAIAAEGPVVGTSIMGGNAQNLQWNMADIAERRCDMEILAIILYAVFVSIL